MQRGLATRKLSVGLSIKRVIWVKTEESSAQIFVQYEGSFILIF